MIKLGCFDSGVPDAACQGYLQQVEQLMRLPLASVIAGPDKVTLQRYVPETERSMSVADVQRGLKTIGFFPAGRIDGICGYRTQSAIRLFQEYVRSVEAQDIVPDGRFGPKTQQHLERWMTSRPGTEWAPTIEQWQAGTLGHTEYTDWLELLENVKQQYLARPNRMLEKVNAFSGRTGTHKVAEWDFSPRANAHLIGIRREEFSGKSDDIFVLLIKGLVFKFQGSTEPGVTTNAEGYPFLVQGQHDYHFGWHQKKYPALRPQEPVLVIRSKDSRLDDSDLESSLEPNPTINIHWGGKGLKGDLKSWSEGCQVISGGIYVNAKNELVDCTSFAAASSKEPLTDTNPPKTRGAYNVLLDLVAALGSDQGATVKYTLLVESDLDLHPGARERLADARNVVIAQLRAGAHNA